MTFIMDNRLKLCNYAWLFCQGVADPVFWVGFGFLYELCDLDPVFETWSNPLPVFSIKIQNPFKIELILQYLLTKVTIQYQYILIILT